MSTSAERMYNHLLSQFRNKPNIKALLDVVGSELDAIEEVRRADTDADMARRGSG